MVRNQFDRIKSENRFSNNYDTLNSPGSRGHRLRQSVLVGDLFRGLLGGYTFLADEDISTNEINVLRDRDYEVRAVLEELPGADDTDVLSLASQEGLVLLGCDKGYGTLIFRDGHPPPLGGILFRGQPRNIADLTMDVLCSGIALMGNYIVVRPGQMVSRSRPLPPRSNGETKMVLLEPPRPRIITLGENKQTGSS